MAHFVLCVLLLAAGCFVNYAAHAQEWSRQVPPVSTPGNGGFGFGAAVCPLDADRQSSRQRLQSTVKNTVQDYIRDLAVSQICGPGLWRNVFLFNSSETDQLVCPGNWTSATTSSVEGCTGASSECRSAFSMGISPAYNKVCGRIIGKGASTPDGFIRFLGHDVTIEDNYLDGVSVTYGAAGSRMHIWTFGAGHSASIGGIARCPCDNPDRNNAPLPPPEVGENYFCDRASEVDDIWTGRDCTADDPCCSFHNPPYFSVQLPSPTTDRIELRICSDQHAGDELLLVLFAEIYVQ